MDLESIMLAEMSERERQILYAQQSILILNTSTLRKHWHKIVLCNTKGGRQKGTIQIIKHNPQHITNRTEPTHH